MRLHIKHIISLLLLTFFTHPLYSQEKSISKKNDTFNLEAFDKLEGMEYKDGTTFYLSKKNDKIIAVQDRKLKWQVNLDSYHEIGVNRKARIKTVFIHYLGLKVTFYNNQRILLIDIESGNTKLIKEKK